MTDPLALLQRFAAALPAVEAWIEQTLDSHRAAAVPVSALGYAELDRCFPRDFLSYARVVRAMRCPSPPLTRLGLPELAEFESATMAGITFNDTFFVVESQMSPRLCFHELVHVAQWSRLGVRGFLWAYGIGLAQHGYRDSPLERMAYELQSQFERGLIGADTLETINRQTDAIWTSASDLLQAAGVET